MLLVVVTVMILVLLVFAYWESKHKRYTHCLEDNMHWVLRLDPNHIGLGDIDNYAIDLARTNNLTILFKLTNTHEFYVLQLNLTSFPPIPAVLSDLTEKNIQEIRQYIRNLHSRVKQSPAVVMFEYSVSYVSFYINPQERADYWSIKSSGGELKFVSVNPDLKNTISSLL